MIRYNYKKTFHSVVIDIAKMTVNMLPEEKKEGRGGRTGLGSDADGR